MKRRCYGCDNGMALAWDRNNVVIAAWPCGNCGGTGFIETDNHIAGVEPEQAGEVGCPSCTTKEVLTPLSAEGEAALAAFAKEFAL